MFVSILGVEIKRGIKNAMKKWIHRISSKNRGFFNWKDVLGGGFNKRILGGIFQYLVKLGVFFNIP
jgi:hypothetical protein